MVQGKKTKKVFQITSKETQGPRERKTGNVPLQYGELYSAVENRFRRASIKKKTGSNNTKSCSRTIRIIAEVDITGG